MTNGQVNKNTIKSLEGKLADYLPRPQIAQVLLDIVQLTSLCFDKVKIIKFENNILTLKDEVQTVKLCVKKGISDIIECPKQEKVA